MTNLSVRPGDEVLIRGRVKEYIPAVGVLVELFSKSDQYEAWVREALVEQVRPAAETRTHKGQRVADVRTAIADLDQLIAARDRAGDGSTADRITLASLVAAREDLVDQLREVGIDYEPEGETR